ncbi:MAG: hypothetical protein WDN29_12315 [Methylovirgula sp.]
MAKPRPASPRARGFNRRVKRQHIGLRRDIADQNHAAADPLGGFGKTIHRILRLISLVGCIPRHLIGFMDPGADFADRMRQMVGCISDGLDMRFRLAGGDGHGHRLFCRFLGGQGQHIRSAAQISGGGCDTGNDITDCMFEGFGEMAERAGSLVLAGFEITVHRDEQIQHGDAQIGELELRPALPRGEIPGFAGQTQSNGFENARQNETAAPH